MHAKISAAETQRSEAGPLAGDRWRPEDAPIPSLPWEGKVQRHRSLLVPLPVGREGMTLQEERPKVRVCGATSARELEKRRVGGWTQGSVLCLHVTRSPRPGVQCMTPVLLLQEMGPWAESDAR
ncbi:hypothetical protein NDU88_005475 [Pleurodeles waltl]|uniref:Uncharacterized protein n=1 Tax=Pleurodeles waltl TaxID=8319 RepID=A0AAV7RL66_PLEWA|nr:hypothetical protein NDU88_005475 [Pleurodeles waltl]